MVQQVILERDAELAALAAAVAAAEAGHGSLVLVEGPAGIGKTTLLRAACRGPGARVLTARGLAPHVTGASQNPCFPRPPSQAVQNNRHDVTS